MPNPALERAKTLTKTLRRALRSEDAGLSLSACQHAIAAGFGRRSWNDLSRHLSATSSLTGWDSARAQVSLLEKGASEAQSASALSEIERQLTERQAGTEDVTSSLLSLQLPTEFGLQKWPSRAKPLLRSPGVAMFVHDVTAITSQPGWVEQSLERVIARNVDRGHWSEEEGRPFLEQFRSQLEALATRPRHSAWPAICFLTVARIALSQGSQARLMELDVWSEIDLIMISFNAQVIQGRVNELGDNLWNLDPHVRRGFAVNAANDAVDMIINLSSEEKKIIPFNLMPDLADHELAYTTLEDEAISSDTPYSSWTKRWKRLRAFDINLWAPVDEDYFHDDLHARIARDPSDPDILLLAADGVLEPARFISPPKGDAYILLIGQGPRIDKIKPIAYCAVRKTADAAKATISVGPADVDEDFPKEDAVMAMAAALGIDIRLLVSAARFWAETEAQKDDPDDQTKDDLDIITIDLTIIDDDDGWTDLPSSVLYAARICKDLFGLDMGCHIEIHEDF